MKFLQSSVASEETSDPPSGRVKKTRCQSTVDLTRQFTRTPNSAALTLENHFSSAEISNLLCEARFKLAAIQNKMISQETYFTITPEEQSLIEALPPRRQWHRFRPRNRHGVSTATVAVCTLRRAILHQSRLPEEKQHSWFVRHRELISAIQKRALSDPEFRFETFQQIAIPKSKDEFRVITKLSIIETVIARCTARWLRGNLDEFFSRHSFAFREVKDGAINDHNTAVSNLIEFRNSAQKPLWIAETDIRGFFDSVPHQAVVASLRLARRRAYRMRRSLDPRGLVIVTAALDAFDFKSSVLQRTDQILRNRSGQIPWPEEGLRLLHDRFESMRFGIPQGVAFGPILSNAILDYADQRVENVISKCRHPVFYGRYCDDTLIASPDRSSCRAVWDAYNGALRKLGLPVHPPVEPVPNGTRSKSRAPYLHASTANGGTPLVEFLGYKLDFNGAVGIRRSTIEKEIQAMDDLANLAFSELRKPGKHNYSRTVAIYSRLQRQLAARAAGRGTLHPNNQPSHGWANLFPNLADSAETRSMLNELDRHRHQILNSFKRMARKGIGRELKKDHIRFFGKSLRFLGTPFSYFGAIREGKVGAL